MQALHEVSSIRELELYKVIREKEERVTHLEDMVARHKLGHDNDVKQMERLEMELLDREECIYKLNKQCFSYILERKRYELMSNGLTAYSMQETIDLKQKEIECLQTQLMEKNHMIIKLETILAYSTE